MCAGVPVNCGRPATEIDLMSKPSLIRRFFSAIWNGITRLRMALSNLVFILLILFIYFAFTGGGPEPLPERAALLLNPVGIIVDQKTQVAPLQALLSEPSPADNEVLLRDVIESIEYARDDPAIVALVMELDYLLYVGISRTQEIVRALESFRASGKPVERAEQERQQSVVPGIDLAVVSLGIPWLWR